MKIFDPSESRRVALKLQEFIDNAIEMTERDVIVQYMPQHAKFLAWLEETMMEKANDNDKVNVVLVKPESIEEIKILLNIQSLSHLNHLKKSIATYVEGHSIKDILSSPNHIGGLVLGLPKVKEIAPLSFSDKSAEKAFAKTEVAQNVAQRHAWQELGELVGVYSQAIKQEGNAVLARYSNKAFLDYSTLDQLSTHIQAEYAQLNRIKSFDAPVRGVDFEPF